MIYKSHNIYSRNVTNTVAHLYVYTLKLVALSVKHVKDNARNPGWGFVWLATGTPDQCMHLLGYDRPPSKAPKVVINYKEALPCRNLA